MMLDDVIASAKMPADLAGLTHDTGPYVFAQMFAGEGMRAKSANKKRLKLLKKIHPRLMAMLRPDEKVLFLTSGTVIKTIDVAFLGVIGQLLNRRAIIVTTQRLLVLQINSRFTPKELHAQVQYPSLDKVKAKGIFNGAFNLHLTKAKKVGIGYMAKVDARRLETIVTAALKNIAPLPDAPGVIEDLCPFCFVAVPGHPRACPSCGGGFKSARTAGLLSLVFPGIGDFYLGHRTFAVLEMFGAGILWLALFGHAMSVSGAIPDETEPSTPNQLLAVAVMIAVAHVMDSLLTYYIGRKGHYPGTRGYTPGGEATALQTFSPRPIE